VSIFGVFVISPRVKFGSCGPKRAAAKRPLASDTGSRGYHSMPGEHRVELQMVRNDSVLPGTLPEAGEPWDTCHQLLSFVRVKSQVDTVSRIGRGMVQFGFPSAPAWSGTMNEECPSFTDVYIDRSDERLCSRCWTRALRSHSGADRRAIHAHCLGGTLEKAELMTTSETPSLRSVSFIWPSMADQAPLRGGEGFRWYSFQRPFSL